MGGGEGQGGVYIQNCIYTIKGRRAPLLIEMRPSHERRQEKCSYVTVSLGRCILPLQSNEMLHIQASLLLCL